MLIFAVLFNIGGAYVIFETARMNIRREVKRKIKAGVPEDQLHTLRFLNSEIENGTAGIHWKESREFEYKGCMYDIVHTKYSGDYTIYECVNDVQEEVLFAQLDKMTKEASSKDQNTRQKTRTLLQLLIHEAIVDNNAGDKPQTFLKDFPAKLINGTTYVYLEVPTPPPIYIS